eukprot:TRINITY_DN25196_c0_g1_i1.p1 TRINITY_DN25196_c0_g1~~TRINITY_DN25196_c0_g1_i1.p1  ORF type:complete len:1497 (-),score=422.99 TRINITY_DN25196_c0_g1_i1:6-4172(-)
MSEPLILHAIKERAKLGKIYTNVGNILIAVNPYKILPLYTPEKMDLYSTRGDKVMPPHPFVIGDDCYRELLESGKSQSILVSGESGAGKTETTKVLLQYLAEIAGSRTAIEQRILSATPILEAFGNAKTIRNNNSSRFGKWIEIHFDKTGKICGAKILSYLLEKTRVPFQAKNERNYHIFYQLLEGGDHEMLNEFGLLMVEDYHYTNQSGCIHVDGIEDAAEFNTVCEAMRELGFSHQEMKTIFRIVAAVLMLGNISFMSTNNDDSKSRISPTSIDTLKRASKLLCVDSLALEKSLISREISIKTEITIIPLDIAAAEECRDTLAKHLYGSLFEWLVKRINMSLSKDLDTEQTKVIGVLDIFGFEIFEKNSFEQLCINFTNEKLQQKFNQTTFKEEEDVYLKENIKYQHVEFIDNQTILDIIEKKPDGIMCILDDELKMPHKTRSDQNFLVKCLQKYSNSDKLKRPIKTPDAFTISHYAGDVTYQVTGFLDKNKDQMYDDLIKVMMASRDQFVVNFMGDTLGQKKTSLSAQFRNELNALMTLINSTNPHYIRCIKPNTLKKPAETCFDSLMSLKQLTYAGLFEAVNIRKRGFPFRYTHKQFYDRYKCLSPLVKGSSYLALCKELLRTIPGNFENVQLGTSMVLYKAEEQRNLELRRNMAIRNLVIYVQALYKRYKAKQKYADMTKAREELRRIMQTGNLEKIQKAVEDAVELSFEFKELNDAKKLIGRLIEEKRLNKLLEENLRNVQGKKEPSQRDLDQMESVLEEAANFGLDNELFKKSKSFFDETVRKRMVISSLLKAVDNSNINDIQKFMSEAMHLKVKLGEDVLHKVESTLKQLQEERGFVDELLKVLSVPPNPTYPGVSITQIGEVEVDVQAQKALLDCLARAEKFGVKTEEGLKALHTAELVERIRDATREDDWQLVESLIIDAQNRLNDLLDAPEISSAHEQVCLRKGIGETIENLQKAAQTLDANMLHINIRAALRYDLQGIEPYRDLEINIRRIAAALENAIVTKNLEKLIAATAMADRIGYAKEDYVTATKTKDIVMGILNEISEHVLVVPEREQTEDLLERCTKVGIVNEQTKLLQKRLNMNKEELIKLQMKGALAVNDNKRVLKKTSQLKELFFKQFGSAIEYKQCPIFRTPSDWVKGKVFGKDKLKIGMFQWNKEIIPTSLTIINDKSLLKDSIRIFKNILGWAGDKQLSYPAMLAKEILEKGITHEQLRNEILAQVVKQITHNPNKESTRKMWQLMQLCLKSFAPTAEFENYLEAWLRSQGPDHRYVVQTLHATQFRGALKVAPTPEEITAESNRQYTNYRESMSQARLAAQRTSVTALEDLLRRSSQRSGWRNTSGTLAMVPDEERLFDTSDPYIDFPVYYGNNPHKDPDPSL